MKQVRTDPDETTEAVRDVIARFEENGRRHFKIHRVARLLNKSHSQVQHSLLNLEEEGVLGRWNPDSTGATIWAVEGTPTPSEGEDD